MTLPPTTKWVVEPTNKQVIQRRFELITSDTPIHESGKESSGPAEIRTRDLRFRRPPRYPDYATGPTNMLNN